jgi:hypothetical protein
MRATISFETDVDEVEGTMAVLACSEEHNLRAAADFLSNFTVLDGSTLDVITEVLRLLDMSTDQLRQYRNMLVNFERAKFETMLPQPANAAIRSLGDVREAVESMQKFDSFLAQASPTEDTEETEVVNEPTEG